MPIDLPVSGYGQARQAIGTMNDESARVLRSYPAALERPGTTSEDIDTSSIEGTRALTMALAAGDREAFRVLVERETPRIFRTCYRVLGRIEDAEEVTQETFVLAYRGLGTFRGDGHPVAWLTRIAVREAWRRRADGARRRARSTAFDQGALTVPDEAPGPMAEAVRREQRDRIRSAVGQLPEPYRQVLTLRFFAELSVPEVAAATGRPEGTVKAQLHRGLKRLRGILMEDPT